MLHGHLLGETHPAERRRLGPEARNVFCISASHLLRYDRGTESCFIHYNLGALYNNFTSFDFNLTFE